MTDVLPFQTMARDEAIAAFRTWRTPKSYCRDQFVVCGPSILNFVEMSELRLLTSTCVEWWPSDPEDYPGEKTRWLPEAVQTKFDQRRKAWVRQCHLFLPYQDEWLYCGVVHQAYHQHTGAGRHDDSSHVGYQLSAPLPYEIWVALGGYPHWKAKIAGDAHLLERSDGTRLDQLLGALPDGQTHVELTRWQGDSLEVFLNGDRGFPMYLTDPGDTGTYVMGGDDTDTLEHFSCPCCGIDMDFGRQFTAPRADAIQLFRQFFMSGQAPKEGDEWLTGLPWTREQS